MFQPYDILLVCHSKDAKMLPLVLDKIKQNIFGYNKIHIVSDSINLINTNSPDIIIHYEQEVISADLTKINHRRPGWIYQQIIKLTQDVTLDNYLVIDCDTIINRPISIFTETNTPYFYFTADQYHEQYFNYIKKHFNIEKTHNHSFISEIMFFYRPFVKELFETVNLFNKEKIMEFVYNTVNPNEYLSEFELYGNYITNRYPEVYTHKKIVSQSTGSFDQNCWNLNNISNILSQNTLADFDVITFHTWL
jgi:hypothetical protein